MLDSPLQGVGGQHHDPAASTPGRGPITHFRWGWVGPMAGLDGNGGKKPLDFARVRIPDRAVRNGPLSRLLNSVNT